MPRIRQLAWTATLVPLAAMLVTVAACQPAPEEEPIGDELAEEQLIEEERREEAVEERKPPAEVELVEEAGGTFELTLSGDLEETLRGSAICLVEEADGELRMTLQPDTGALDHPFPYMFQVGVPGYAGSDSYAGAFRITGPDRSSGSVEVRVARIPAADVVLERDLEVRFDGGFTGAAGAGSVEGTVECALSEAEPEGS